MIKIPNTILTTSSLLLPLQVSAASLILPNDAAITVQVVDSLQISSAQPRQENLLLRPVAGLGEATHELPEYCVVVADARQVDDRLRISTQALTCIETDGSDSDIYSGELSAAAYELDESYGLAVCNAEGCELNSEHSFLLKLASRLELEEQENPSAQINEQRRQADGAGVANPLPADRPDPEQN